MAGSGTATLDFGAFPGKPDASVAVTGQAGILAGSLVEAWVLPAATADHSGDEHVVEALEVMAGNIVAGTGFTIYGKSVNQVRRPPPVYAEGWVTSASGVAGGLRQPASRTSADVAVDTNDLIYGQWNVAWAWS